MTSTSSTAQRRVAVAGASGRMGRMLIEAICASDDCLLAGALDLAGSPAVGQDAAAFLGRASGVAITADLRAGLEGWLGENAVMKRTFRGVATVAGLIERNAGIA